MRNMGKVKEGGGRKDGRIGMLGTRVEREEGRL